MLTKIKDILLSWPVFIVAIVFNIVNQWTFTVGDNTWLFDSRTEGLIALGIVSIIHLYEYVALKFTNKEVN